MTLSIPPSLSPTAKSVLLPSPVSPSLHFAGVDPKELILKPAQTDAFLKVLDAFKARLTAGVPQGDLKAVNADLKTIGGLANQFPQGSFDIQGNDYVIDPFDGQAPLKIPTDKRKVFGPGTSVETFMTEAFGKEKPRLVICPVGWTVPDPDNVARINPVVNQKFEVQKKKLIESMKVDSGADFEKAFTKKKKQIIKDFYEAAFKQWWGPIQQELKKQVDRNGLNMGEVCFLTSASYDGIDKAAIDFAKNAGMKVANVTPYTYARWMNTDSTDPLLVTNTIADYAEACAGADVTLVTGGREHTLKEDIARGLIGGKTAVIAADILKEIHDITVPAFTNGKIENAAAYMQNQGFSVANMSLAQNQSELSGLKPSQRNTVAVLEKLFNQINIGN
ncbi:MAG: hypothetical protein K2X66_04350 [Cyanobacteria bacterium]|nr:hypothetical protein [Cyanobacteriota bacterium]